MTVTESVMQRWPSDAKAFNNLARDIAVLVDAEPKLIHRASELAQKAVALEPEQGPYWNTLGVVLYRAGQYRAAIGSLEKSEELSEGEHFGYDGIFLTMAHQRLGNHKKARDVYDCSIAWREQNNSDDELDRFYREAEERFESDSVDLNTNDPKER